MWPSQNIHRPDDYSHQDQFSYDPVTTSGIEQNFLAASANANQAWTHELSASLANPFFGNPNDFANFSPTAGAFGLQYPVFLPGIPSTSPFQFNADYPQPAGVDNLGNMSRPGTATGSANPRPPTQLELNARAAELKERLLKNRNQKDRLSASPVVDRTRNVLPSPAAQGTVNVSKTPPVRNETIAQPPPAALPTPKTPAGPTKPAKPAAQPNEADILELISSHMASAETTRDSNKDSSKQQSHAKRVQTTPSQGIPGLSNREQKTDGKKAESEPKAQSTKTAVAMENETKQAMSPPEEGEIVAGSAENLTTRTPVPIVVPVMRGKSQATFAAESRTFHRAGPSTMSKPPQNGRGAGTVPAAPIRAESMPKGKYGSRTEPRTEDQMRRPSTSTSSYAKPLDVQGKMKTSSTTHNLLSPGEMVDRGRTVEEDFAHLLERDRDLRDWLTLTGYHNFDVRTKRLNELRTKQLERNRKAKEIEAEIKRMEAEKKKLEQDEEVEMIFMQPSGREKNIKPIIATKREYEEDEDDKANVRLGKAARISDLLGRPESRNGLRQDEDNRNGPRGYEQGSQAGSGQLAHRDSRPGSPVRLFNRLPPPLNRSRSPRRSRSASRYNEVSRYPNPYRNYRERDRVYDRGYETYRDNSPYLDRYVLPSPGMPRFHDPAKDVDLGGPGETRFFIVKSFNEDNVRKCMDDGVWATQVQNGQILTAAFATCKNVILFFSINKSRAFQGYARMVTAPSPDTPKPRWMKGIHWETSPPFRIEWLSKVEVEFRRIGHLKNSLNENQAVLVGKDGQEIEEQCGRDLLHEMHRVAEERQRYYRPPRGRSPAQRGRGGFAGRGGANKYFIKRET